MTEDPGSRRAWIGPIARIGLILAALLAVGLAWRALPLGEALASARAFLRRAGPLGWVAYVLGYALAAVLLVPGTAPTLVGAVLYGPILGTILVSAGSTLGAAAAFLLARTAARRRVRSWLADDPRFAAVDRAVADRGATVVFLLRLSPVLPYNLLNYAFGLTGVAFGPYLLASWAGMLPATVAYVLLGASIDPETRPDGFGLGWWAALVGTTLAATIYLGRLARGALAGPAGPGTDEVPR